MICTIIIGIFTKVERARAMTLGITITETLSFFEIIKTRTVVVLTCE